MSVGALFNLEVCATLEKSKHPNPEPMRLASGELSMKGCERADWLMSHVHIPF